MKKIRQLLVLIVLLSSVSLFAQNRYLNFDGNDDFIDFQSSTPAFSTNLTIEAWITTTSTQEENTIVCWGESGDDNVQFRTTTSGKLQLGMDEYGVAWEVVSSSQSVNTGVPVHVAAVKSGTNVTLYVDGVEAGTGSLTAPVTVPEFAIGTFRGSSFYSGDIDDVRIWDDVRTAQEIQNNMNTELVGDEQGLVAYYKLNESTGTTANDSQTSGTYDGTLSGFDFDSGSVLGSQWPVVYYVDLNATGNDDGTSWNDAFSSLQSALNIALSGDEIWVATGTYYPSNEVGGSGTRFQSFQMIDGVEIYGGFAGTETTLSERTDFRYGEANETILSGDFNNDDVITGINTTLVITNKDENAYHVFRHPDGYTLTSSAILDGFTLKGGNASGSDGSGEDDGGGITNMGLQSPTINNCTFTGNTAKDKGGAISNTGGGSPEITNCQFIKNVAAPADEANDGAGGAINNYGSAPTIVNCLFYGNQAGDDGDDLGGAIFNNNGSNASIINCTVIENSSYSGGGIYNDDSDAIITNTIIYGNIIEGGAGSQVRNWAGSDPTFTNCNIEGGWDGSGVANSSSTPVDGGGNINSDPEFTGTTLNPSHPFSLLGSSPCADAGDNSANSETYDLRGNGFERKLDKTDGSSGTIDIGAYEYKYGTDFADDNIIFVNDNASGDNDGTNWTNAYTDLQSALSAVSSGTDIWVAAGTYKPSVEVGNTGDRYKAFQLQNGVTIYGGFAGTEVSPEQRTDYGQGDANETIISGDIGAGNADCYHVFHHPDGTALDNTAVLDGCSVTGGYADDSKSGGGMYNRNSSPTIRNCSFYNNYAINYGGGIYNFQNSETIMTNCTFDSNSASRGGGAVSNSNTNSYVTITNCTFSNNNALSGSFGGGAIYNITTSHSNITNSTFYNNTAIDHYGGAIKGDGSSIVNCTSCTFYSNTTNKNGGAVGFFTGGGTFINCLFYDNSVTGVGSRGGAICQNSTSTDFELVNCTFAFNTSTHIAGGVSIEGTTTGRTVKNCLFWNNTDVDGNPELYIPVQATTVSNSCIKGGVGSVNNAVDGGGNVATNPHFANAASDDYTLSSYSSCKDAGNNGDNSESYDVRGEGYARIQNGTIDIGAYEFTSGTDETYATATWTGTTDTDWDTDSNWNGIDEPTQYYDITIPDVTNDPVIASTSEASTHDVTINSNVTITIASDGSGTGSFIPYGTFTNNGTFAIQRFLGGDSWHLVTPSTTNVTANDFYWDDAPMSWLASHSEATNNWTYNTDLETSLPVGQGWSVWVADAPRTDALATMTGTPRTSNLSASLSYSGSGAEQGWNLLGNPFTASLDWDEGSWGANTTGTVYVWDNDYNTTGDYRTWNGTAGDLTGGIIPISQGFFVKASSEGDFTIPADARVHSTEVFYKNEDLENTSPYVRLQMDFEEHGNTVFIGFPEHGTSGFDIGGDADKLFSNAELPQMYVLENSRKLSTNSLEPLGVEAKVVPLNLEQVVDGEYTFTMTQQENLPGVNILLEDVKTGVTQDMREKPVYEFTAQEGDEKERFLLHFKKSTIGFEEPMDQENSNIRIYSDNNTIYVQSAAQAEKEPGLLEIYNLTGQKLLERDIQAGNLVSHQGKVASSYIIVRVIKPSGIKTEKVFIK